MRWKHHEPFFWSLFGAGGVISAFCAPVIVLLIGLLLPLHLLPEAAYNYESLHALAQSLWVKGAVLIIVALSLWHCAHRIFHGLHDLGVSTGPLARTLTYGLAGFSSLALLILLLTL
ncbi:fumarate reductase subunit FrdD [Marinobacter sp.]|uniref:fumarate reductase subunit FrdD n=1 Tax=Marinobacter sp. TaxID=50741 RepID=UPI0038502046